MIKIPLLTFALLLTLQPLAAFAEDLTALTERAAQGEAEAQVRLGLIYFNGQDTPQDDTTAAKWFTMAAEQGNAKAQYNLGTMYDIGRGVPQDYAEAAKWFTKAAEQGLALAQFKLGYIYDDGQGVPQDYSKAHMWWNLAAAQGNKGAIKMRDRVAKKMTAAQVAKAQEAARACVAREYKGC